MTILDMLTKKYGINLTPVEVAEVLGCHQTHVRALCASGDLPAVRIGSRWFIPAPKLAALLEGASEASNNDR